jgi:sugar lactone lactonase YvrE
VEINMDEVRCVVPAGDICGEGAVWHPGQSALYWTDINRFLVHRYDPSRDSTETWLFGEPVTSVNLTTDPELLLLVLGSNISLWSPHTHPKLRRLYNLQTAPEMRFNDARIDPRGSLWAGTMRNNVGPQGEDLHVDFTGGVLYRIDPDGTASKWMENVGISNTVAWSPDRKRFYFGDSPANIIYSFAYDEQSGAITDGNAFLTAYPLGSPDGSTVDAQGYLWNARYGGRCLIRVAPTGEVDRVVSLPTSNPTTCTFGGPELKTLYITSARSADRLSGSVFAMKAEIGGCPDSRYRLLPT